MSRRKWKITMYSLTDDGMTKFDGVKVFTSWRQARRYRRWYRKTKPYSWAYIEGYRR